MSLQDDIKELKWLLEETKMVFKADKRDGIDLIDDGLEALTRLEDALTVADEPTDERFSDEDKKKAQVEFVMSVDHIDGVSIVCMEKKSWDYIRQLLATTLGAKYRQQKSA